MLSQLAAQKVFILIYILSDMFKSKSRANLTDFLNQIQQIYSNEKPKKTILLKSIPVLNSSKSLLMVQSAVEPDPDDPPASASANTSASASAGRVHTPGHNRGQEAMTSRDFEKLKRRAMEVRLLPPLLLLLSSFPHPPPPPPCSSGYGGRRMSFLQQHHRSQQADEEL